MIVKKAAIGLFAFLACVQLAPAPPAHASTNPISIQQCFITVPKAMSKLGSGTQIDYTNRGHKTATQVTFAVGYRNAANHFLRRVVDDGNFAPGVQIVHHFDLYNDVTYGGKTVQSCSAIKVRWADGTTWSA